MCFLSFQRKLSMETSEEKGESDGEEKESDGEDKKEKSKKV